MILVIHKQRKGILSFIKKKKKLKALGNHYLSLGRGKVVPSLQLYRKQNYHFGGKRVSSKKNQCKRVKCRMEQVQLIPFWRSCSKTNTPLLVTSHKGQSTTLYVNSVGGDVGPRFFKCAFEWSASHPLQSRPWFFAVNGRNTSMPTFW